jgi:hypothetical protein
MKLKVFLIALSFLFLEGFSQSKKEYIIGVEFFQEYLPYSSVNEEKVYSGFNREFLDLFANYLGVKFIYKPLPVKKLYRNLTKGKIDFKFPDNSYWGGDFKKGVTIHYSEPGFTTTDGVFVLPKKINLEKEGLKKLGFPRGFTPFMFMGDINSGKIATEESSSMEKALLRGIMGYTDGVFVNIEVGKYYLKSQINDEDALIPSKKLPSSPSGWCLSTLYYPDVTAKMKAFLKAKAKKIKMLEKKYGIGS